MSNEDLSLKLFLILTRATQSITKRLEADIKNYGLNPTEFGVLEFLFHKGDQPIQKIGEKILLASSSITYVVDKLEKKDLLIRQSCPDDRRVTYATLTESGKAFMRDIFPKHKKVVEQLFEALDKEEKEKMILQLKQLGYRAKGL